MFQIKDFTSIVASMLNHMRGTQDKITDFNVGSVARTLVEAPAIEIEELYQNMFFGLKEAIPTSVFLSFGFDALPAEAASGVLQFSAPSAAAAQVVIPAGTRVTAVGGGLAYITQTDAIIEVGQSHVDAVAWCEITGSSTNVLANTLTALSVAIQGVSNVTNPAAFDNGRDLETDDERKARFQGYISTLPRGTVSAVAYGARSATVKDASGQTVESVRYAVIVEPYLVDANIPVGLVECYIHNGVGGTSPALIAAARQIIDGYRLSDGTAVPGWKAAGVIVNTMAAPEVSVVVSGSITVDSVTDEASAIVAAAAAVSDYLQTLDIGYPAIRSEIIAQIMSVPGVYNVALTLPAADIAVTANQKIMPSTVTLT